MKKTTSLFLFVFFLILLFDTKEFDESVRKKSLTEVARRIEENNKDYLVLLAFEISFV